MKFTMHTSLDRYLWLISLIWAACQMLGVLSIETKTSLPENIMDTLRKANGTELRKLLNDTRRIINGREVNMDRPYMVYLKLPASNEKFSEYKRWLCGGVIVHEEFILTSAACIEDVKHFYVVAGTYKFSFSEDRYNNPCIKNGAKKAVWKCIPRNYIFDGHENDNIRWMNNDIAIVKLEDEFDFTRRVRGCDYPAKPICYNNQSSSYEDPGTHAYIAGWGSTDRYNDWVNTRRGGKARRSEIDEQALLEALVEITDKPMCKRRWGHRYYNIIDNYMICTSDMASELSEICQEKYVDCTDILSESEEDHNGNRRSWDPEEMGVHSANHNYSITRRKDSKQHFGGFCENDHGGPLIYGHGVTSIVIGIISACLVKEKTNKCYGPFLYTSVYKNRMLINCAIYKDVGQDCSKLFRAGGQTHVEVEISWADHPDGPAKNEINALRKANKDISKAIKEDSPMQHKGVVLRAHNKEDDKEDALIAQFKQTTETNATAT